MFSTRSCVPLRVTAECYDLSGCYRYFRMVADRAIRCCWLRAVTDGPQRQRTRVPRSMDNWISSAETFGGKYAPDTRAR